MEKLPRFFLTFCLFFLATTSFPQSKENSINPVEMADGMRSEGKIYVVVTIILVVLSGLIAYLFLMDRKLTRIEKMLGQNRPAKS